MMEYFAVEGGWPLEGQVPVHGAKNSALPILAATLLATGRASYITAHPSPTAPPPWRSCPAWGAGCGGKGRRWW